jgi:hypothetical protein
MADQIVELKAENARLVRLCAYCNCSLVRCYDVSSPWAMPRMIKCCPDCDHRDALLADSPEVGEIPEHRAKLTIESDYAPHWGWECADHLIFTTLHFDSGECNAVVWLENDDAANECLVKAFVAWEGPVKIEWCGESLVTPTSVITRSALSENQTKET